MSRKTLLLGAALLTLLVPSVRGQSAAGPSPGLEGELAGETGSFGFDTQDFWVPASKFAAWGGPWSPGNLGYWSSAPLFTTVQAPVELPAGALLTRISCYYHNMDGWDGFTASIRLQKSRYNALSNVSSTMSVGLSIVSGTQEGYHVTTRDFDETIHYRVGDFHDYYTLVGMMSRKVGFRGCKLEWNRQVTPAPASATFADVPTTHPFFRFVESVAASGITAGCGGGLFCVNSPITRGEMAVFLAVALGLHFPF